MITAEPVNVVRPLLLTVAEAADALRISVRLLWTLTQSGEIRSVRIGQRGVRYAPAELQRWIDRQCEISSELRRK